MMATTQTHVPFDGGALHSVLDAWRTRFPQAGIFALVAEADRQHLPLLQAACRERQLPLMGGVFPALITPSGFESHGVCLCCLAQRPEFFLLDPDALGVGGTAIAQATLKALEATPPGGDQPTLFMVFDGLLPDIASRLDEVYLELADRVKYAGVNAGSETFTPIECVFTTDACVAGGVLGMLWPSDVQTVVEHGYPAPDRFVLATTTAGNRVAQIDWRPAFDVYQQLIRDHYGVALTPDNFYQYGVHFPLGLVRASDQVLIRIPVGLEPDGSLICIGEVPENSMLMLMQAPPPDDPACMARVVSALPPQDPDKCAPLLVFYCAGRRLHMAAGAAQELATLARHTGARSVVGALTLGEIGTGAHGGYPLFHNAALVISVGASA